MIINLHLQFTILSMSQLLNLICMPLSEGALTDISMCSCVCVCMCVCVCVCVCVQVERECYEFYGVQGREVAMHWCR